MGVIIFRFTILDRLLSASTSNTGLISSGNNVYYMTVDKFATFDDAIPACKNRVESVAIIFPTAAFDLESIKSSLVNSSASKLPCEDMMVDSVVFINR